LPSLTTTPILRLFNPLTLLAKLIKNCSYNLCTASLLLDFLTCFLIKLTIASLSIRSKDLVLNASIEFLIVNLLPYLVISSSIKTATQTQYGFGDNDNVVNVN